MKDNKKEEVEKLLDNSKTISESKKKQMKARLDQEKEIDHENRPAGDIYSKVEKKGEKSGVEIPTEEAVEEAKDWVDNANQM